MVRKTKYLVLVLTAFTIVFSCMLNIDGYYSKDGLKAVIEKESYTKIPEIETVTNEYDFSTTDIVWESGGSAYVSGSDKNLVIPDTDSVRLKIETNGSEDYDIDVVSYDIKLGELGRDFNLRAYDNENNIIASCFFDSNGRFVYSTRCAAVSASYDYENKDDYDIQYFGASDILYEAQKWYNLCFVINKEERRTDFYIDNIFIGSTAEWQSESNGVLSKIIFYGISNNGNYLYIDNIKSGVLNTKYYATVNGNCGEADSRVVIQVLKDGYTYENLKEGADYLEYVLWHSQVKSDENGDFSFTFEVEKDKNYNAYVRCENLSDVMQTKVGKNSVASIIPENLGNIFYDCSDLSFKLDAVPDSYTMQYEITSEGEIIHTGTLAIDGENKFSIDLSDKVKQYGFFEMKASLYDDEGGQYDIDDIRFSVAHTVDDGSLNSKMGICNHFAMSHGSKAYAQKLNMLNRAGFSLVRDNVLWTKFEETKDVYKLSDFEKDWMSVVKNSGQETMIILSGSNSVETKEHPPYSDSAVAAFADYAENVAAQTEGGVNSFEIWNEYNMDGSSFNPDKRGPEGYVKLLKAAYPAIKRGNQAAFVYGMVTAYVSKSDGYSYDTIDWIEEVLKQGGGDYMDGVSIHMYVDSKSPEAADYAGIIDEVRSLVAEYGYDDYPIIVSELGYSSHSKFGPDTEIRQAKYMIREFALIHNHTERFICYVSQEKQSANEGDNKYGITRTWSGIDIPYEAKPAYLAIANYNALLGNAEIMEENKTTTGIYNYKFKSRKGRNLYMIWNSNEEETTHSVCFATPYVKIYDMYGNSNIVENTSGAITVTISGEPVYVEEINAMDLYVADENNKIITSLSGVNTAKAVLDINPELCDEEECVLAIATYKDNILQNVNINTVGENQKKATAELEVAGADNVKAFVFSDFNTLKPMIESIKIK